MRRRSTFVHGAELEFDPSEITLQTGRLFHSGVKATREERLTFALNDFHPDLLAIIQHLGELHIHWSPESSPGSIAPFLSRSTPGLHVFYTPLNQPSSDTICTLLRTAFSNELKCQSLEASFTAPVQSSDSLQYHSILPSLSHFVAYIQRNICSQSDQQCFHDAGLLNIVDYLDIDYDSISKSLVLTAFWSKPPPVLYDPIGERTTLDQWPLDIPSIKDGKVEVGILSKVPSMEPHEIQLGGFLTVVGEDNKPKATQFSFPSRHHILSRPQAEKQAYTVSFQKPTGLHPTLEITFPSTQSLSPPPEIPADSECSLNAYFTLPSSIFADEYAFKANDTLFEQSHNLRSLRSISGELDLEAPDYVVPAWGSAMLLELATPDPSTAPTPDQSWDVTVPLHLRYQPPAIGGFDEIRVPWPVVFWACAADDEVKFTGNPFDRVQLGYDRLFDSQTMFYHLKPAPRAENEGRLVESIRVPVLDTSRVGGDAVAERVTLVVILLGFGWVLWKLWPGIVRQFGTGGSAVKEADVRNKKKQ